MKEVDIEVQNNEDGISLKGVTTIDEVFIKSILVGAISAGLCAVMNLIIQYLDNKKEM